MTRLKNRNKIGNKYLRYYKADLTIYKTVLLNIDYDGNINLEEYKPYIMKNKIYFECQICHQKFLIIFPKYYFDDVPHINDDYRELDPLIEHIRKEHKKIIIVQERLIKELRKSLKLKINYSNVFYFWRDIGDFDSLIKCQNSKKCSICRSFKSSFSYCLNHLEFIKNPELSRCLNFKPYIKAKINCEL